MSNGPWRLLYKNSSNVNTVLGVMQDEIPSGAYNLKKARWKPRNRGIDKISFIGEKDLFKNLPQDTSNFGTTEPGIYWQGFRFTKEIVGVNTSTDSFRVNGDVTNDFEEGGAIEVVNSSRSDEGTIYKVKSDSNVTYNSSSDTTDIVVVENVSDSTVNGSLEAYENIFRGYANSQGKITEAGNVKFTLWGFLKRIGQENVNISNVSTTIDDVMSNLTPSGYTYDSPNSSNVDYIDDSGNTQTGYAPVDDWSLQDVDRAVGVREKARKYGYAIKVFADKRLRFEPVGFAGSIDTIDSPAEGQTSNTRGNWKEWSAGDTNLANLVNSVRVVNSKDGNKYDSGLIEDSSSIDKHGRRTPKGGNPVKVGYVSSDTEAKRVAHNLIRSSQNPDEGGIVKVAGRYTNNVTNSTFTLNDSVRSIDSETFTAWSQVNFYPENKTELEFEFENQSEKDSDLTDDIRGERSQILPGASENVGNINLDAENDTASSDNDTNEDDKSPDTSGSSSTAFGGTAYNYEALGPAGLSDPATVSTTVPTFSTLDVEFYLVTVNFQLDYDGTGDDLINLEIENTTTNTTIFNENINIGWVSTPAEVCRTITAIERSQDGGDTIEAKISNYDEGDGGLIDINVDAVRQHDHTTSGSTVAHNHAVIVTDNGHGAPGDPSEHVISGETVQKLIDLLQEDKTDR